MRTELPEDLLNINQAILRNINGRVPERPVQGRTLGLIEPVARIQRQQLDFGALWEVGRLVDHQASRTHVSLDRHAVSVTLDRPPNKELHPTGAGVVVSAGG